MEGKILLDRYVEYKFPYNNERKFLKGNLFYFCYSLNTQTREVGKRWGNVLAEGCMRRIVVVKERNIEQLDGKKGFKRDVYGWYSTDAN